MDLCLNFLSCFYQCLINMAMLQIYKRISGTLVEWTGKVTNRADVNENGWSESVWSLNKGIGKEHNISQSLFTFGELPWYFPDRSILFSKRNKLNSCEKSERRELLRNLCSQRMSVLYWSRVWITGVDVKQQKSDQTGDWTQALW